MRIFRDFEIHNFVKRKLHQRWRPEYTAIKNQTEILRTNTQFPSFSIIIIFHARVTSSSSSTLLEDCDMRRTTSAKTALPLNLATAGHPGACTSSATPSDSFFAFLHAFNSVRNLAKLLALSDAGNSATNPLEPEKICTYGNAGTSNRSIKSSEHSATFTLTKTTSGNSVSAIFSNFGANRRHPGQSGL